LKAVVQTEYGSPEVLEFKDIEKPSVKVVSSPGRRF
jgi:hypothetical protein